MIVLSAFRDFADGLARGLPLFLTERNDFTADAMSRLQPGRGKPQNPRR